LPQNIPAFAQECLTAIAQAGLGSHLSIGGAFGLAHYYEYRTTHDIDAWWATDATRVIRSQIISVIEKTLSVFGQIRTRAWGDVVSIDLRQNNRSIFSFQIAARSILLQAEITGIWQGDIRLDSFEDLIASKMTALVNRGAPRDFLDIYTLCEKQLTSISICWQLWQKRQQLSDENDDFARAKLAVQANLARIEATRPIVNHLPEEYNIRLRNWFKTEFLNGLD
jgi:hypothetical protein